MQTELNKLAGLKRELKVTLPVEEVSAAYQKRLKEVAKQIKMPGFRPGTVPPLDLVEKKYDSGLKNEVAGELMQQSFEKALAENNLKIAGQPQVHPEPLEKNKPFVYVAEFEIYPDIELKDLTDIEFDKLIAEVTDEDVEKMLEKIQHQQAEWDEVEREAKEGDRLLIDFVGTIEKESFEGGTAKDFSLELGSKKMIPGFEEALIGVKLREMKEITIPFPNDYPAENLAGKEAVFEVTIQKIEAPKLPEINDALAEKVGIKEGVEKLMSEVRNGMERELEQAIQARLKMNVLDKLVELNPIEVPEVLLEMEIQNLQRITQQQMATQQGLKELPDVQLPKEPYIEQAKKRVVLGLLLGEVIKAYNIKVDGAKVREKIEEVASAYHKPKEVIDWYYKNKQLLSEIEALVVEDEAIAKLLEKAKVEEKPSAYDEVVNVDQK